MNNIDCGRVCPIDKGAYNATTHYEALDMVKYNGGVYFCTNTPPSAGVLPTNTDYFFTMVEPPNKWEESDVEPTLLVGGRKWEIEDADRYDYEYMVYADKHDVLYTSVSLVVDIYLPNASYCVKNESSNDITVWNANLEDVWVFNKFVITANEADTQYTNMRLFRRKRTNHFKNESY